jgi:hypothetical protein
LIHYALIFDEISIRKQVLFDGTTMKGYVDFGELATEPDEKPEAKSAMFVLASEINGNKRIPIGYALTNGLKCDLMAEIIRNSLIKMNDAHARVLTVTFDGLASNFAAAEKLGATLNLNYIQFGSEIQPYFPHPSTGSKVFVIPDPMHMFKLLRNTFKAYGTFINSNGQVSEKRMSTRLAITIH